ncbi:unnamed protein product [Diamesa hyperborea]
MLFYREKILNQEQLRKLSEHKYSVTSNSLLEPYLQPYWNWLVQKVPLYVAPNCITIVGLIVNIVTTLILMAYNNSQDINYSPPRWPYLVCALGLFVYQSLDAIDGKQARRTNTSSPLGELFDHGCDSISTVFVAISTCVSVPGLIRDHHNLMFLEVFCVYALFYCAHWQTYISGTLHFGKIDVTEAQYSVITIHLISFIIGPEVWSIKLFQSVEPWCFIIIMTILTGSLVVSDFISSLRKGGAGKNGSSVAVVAHMTKSPMSYFETGLIGPLFLFLNQYFNEFIPEYYVLWAALLWCSGDLFFYCLTVCLEICAHLKIKLFTIPYNPPKMQKHQN